MWTWNDIYTFNKLFSIIFGFVNHKISFENDWNLPKKAYGVCNYITNNVSLLLFYNYLFYSTSFSIASAYLQNLNIFNPNRYSGQAKLFPLSNCKNVLFFFRVTVIVLIVESRWTESPRRKFIIEKNSTCYEHEDFKIIQDCHPCTGMLYRIE